MEQKVKKRNLYGSIILIVLGALVFIGVSYAWLTVTLSGTKNQSLIIGDLTLELHDETGEGLLLENAVPKYDAVGLTQVPYTFTLTNTGTIDSEYTIYLDDEALETGETQLPDGVIKYNIMKDGTSMATNLLSNVGSNPNRVLETGVIPAGTTYTYDLRLWLDENMTNEDMNKVFRGKIRVVASQVKVLLPTDESCFVVDATGTTITNYLCATGENTVLDVVIPSMINRKTITKIGSGAFQDVQLLSVFFPETITSIGSFSFQYNYLTMVDIPEGVTNIEEGAFSGNNLTKISLPSSITSIGAYSFLGNQLPTVTIPSRVTTIGSGAFRNNLLTTVTIPSSVTTIGNYAFYDNQLTSVIVKGKSSTAGFTSFGSSVFGWASGFSDANITWNG